MESVTIAGLARAGGVGVETVRYYQRCGLLDLPMRGPDSGVRRYGPDDIQRLRFIRAAQAAGFSLAEIGALLRMDAGTDRAPARALALERIHALDDEIARLSIAHDALLRLANACAVESAGPCPIIAAFECPGPTSG